MVAIAITDLALIYLIPVAAFIDAWLALALAVYVLVRSPLDFAFKHDLRRKFEERRKLPSGARLRLSYVYVAKLLLGDNCTQAAFLYRVSRFFARRRLHVVAQAVHSFSKLITHLDVSPYAEI